MALPDPWTKVPSTKTIESGQAWVDHVVRKHDGVEGALKRLKNTKRVERFRREIRTMRELGKSVDCVPSIIDEGESDGRAYYVMRGAARAHSIERSSTGVSTPTRSPASTCWFRLLVL